MGALAYPIVLSIVGILVGFVIRYMRIVSKG